MYKIPSNTLFIGQKLIYVPECHSTNSLLSEFSGQAELPEGATLITSHQTAGRGQRGNRWESEPGKNLTFSVLLRPGFMQAQDQFHLNMAVSLAAASALQGGVVQPIRLKWPNDIFVGDRKIGGILIENQLTGSFLSTTILGMGINVNQASFAFPGASSLANASGHAWDLNDTLHRLLKAIEVEYLALRAGTGPELKQRYLEWLYQINEPHRYRTGENYFTGTIKGIEDDGKLCVWVEGRIMKYSNKEIEFLGDQ